MAKNKKKYTRLELMAEAPVRGAILKLAVPTILSQTMSLFYNLISAWYLGLMGDPFQIAAISLASPVTMVIQAVGNIFATGASPYMSRKLGAGDMDSARRASSVAFYTAFALSAITIVIYFIVREPLLGIIGTSENTIAPTRTYLTIVTLFSWLQVLSTALSGTLRSEGGTKESMIGMGGGSILNVFLTPLFIFGFDMGIAGAAWGQVGAFAYTLIYFVTIFIRKKTALSISLKDFRPSKEIYVSIIKFGVPSALSNALMSVTGILGNRVAASIDDLVIAAQGIISRISMIAFMMNFGFCLGYQPFAAYNYGAKNYKRMMGAFKVSLVYSTAIGVFIGLILLIIPGPILRIFTNDEDVIRYGIIIARGLSLSIPFTGCQNTFMYTFQAVDKPVHAMLITVGRQLLYIPFLYGLTSAFGLYGFAFVQAGADILIAIIATILVLPIMKKLVARADAQDSGVVEEGKL